MPTVANAKSYNELSCPINDQFTLKFITHQKGVVPEYFSNRICSSIARYFMCNVSQETFQENFLINSLLKGA